MSEYLTQSRPYAEAIFQISEQDDAIDSWIQDLTLISNAFQDQAVKSLIETPDISQKEKKNFKQINFLLCLKEKFPQRLLIF